MPSSQDQPPGVLRKAIAASAFAIAYTVSTSLFGGTRDQRLAHR